MKVSTLVFDLDGTISDPSSGIIKCVNYALQCHGLATQSDESISAEIGPPLDLMFRKFMPDITDRVIDDLVFSYRERFATDGFAENILYSGIPEAFQSLRDAGLAAHNNQLKSVAVLWGFGSAAELAAEKPAMTLSAVSELLTSFETIK